MCQASKIKVSCGTNLSINRSRLSVVLSDVKYTHEGNIDAIEDRSINRRTNYRARYVRRREKPIRGRWKLDIPPISFMPFPSVRWGYECGNVVEYARIYEKK